LRAGVEGIVKKKVVKMKKSPRMWCECRRILDHRAFMSSWTKPVSTHFMLGYSFPSSTSLRICNSEKQTPSRIEAPHPNGQSLWLMATLQAVCGFKLRFVHGNSYTSYCKITIQASEMLRTSGAFRRREDMVRETMFLWSLLCRSCPPAIQLQKKP
jgi:hypothetical protein